MWTPDLRSTGLPSAVTRENYSSSKLIISSAFKSMKRVVERGMSRIKDCISEVLVSILSEVFKLSREDVIKLFSTGKLRVAGTPDPRLGDYGVPLHTLLKDLDKSIWNEIGSELSRKLLEVASEKCNIEKAEFVNGYLNITLNHSTILRDIAEKFLTGDLLKELAGIGRGERVIVEHTSANPVHPLHIGSGRNSVLGDVLARLLRKLGFEVNTRFYVNDLGRQIATLVFGVQIVESANIKRPDHVKVDHWYGVVYAATNTLIELERLKRELRLRVNQALGLLENIIDMLMSKNELRDLVDALITIREVLAKVHYVHSSLNLMRKLYTMCKWLGEKQLEDSNLANLIKRLLEVLSEYRKLWGEYKKYLVAELRISSTYPDLYSHLRSAIKDHESAESAIRDLMRRAERRDPEVLSLVNRVAQDVLKGFNETLSKLDIVFNGFDFESSETIVSLAKTIVSDVSRTKYARVVGGALEVDLNSAAQDHVYIRDLFHPDQAGRFIIQRSDGTTLYITRDIAYTLYKFKVLGASRVYNVIAVEQEREQKQVKATLYILGYTREAENLHHFMYEMVHLKGMRMSGRRGVYYTIDELLVDMENCIFKKLVKERGVFKPDSEVVSKLAIANTRSLLLSVEPGKVLSLDPTKLCEYEQGIIVEYAFVRAQGILRNAFNIEPLRDRELDDKVRELLNTILISSERPLFSIEEKSLIELLADFDEVLIEAYRELKLNRVLEYAVKLALQFNKFYEKHPVVGERDEKIRAWRLLLVYTVFRTLAELMDVLGLPKLQKI
jgi:arginyl-tRNA synthetase